MASDPDGAAREQFRSVMRRAAATVSIVATREAGCRFGMTATTVTPVSMAPPSLLVIVNRGASIHDALLRRGAFSISMLAERHVEQSAAFAGKLTGEERFAVGDWRDCERGLPYLADAQAVIACAVERLLGYGTHTIVVGRVLEARAADTVEPLIYLDGGCQSTRLLGAASAA